MKIKLLYGTLSLIILFLLTIAATDVNNSDEPKKTNKDVIKFSHAVHKEVTDCASCHTNVMESFSLSDRLLP